MLVEKFRKDNNITMPFCQGLEESPFWVGDIESSLDEAGNWNFELLVLCDGYRFYSFTIIDEAIDFLFDLGENISLYFHNLDFDMLFFLKEETFLKYVEDVSLIASGNLTIGFQVKNVFFKNSLNLFPMTLKNIVTKFLGVCDEDWANNKANVLDLDKDTLLKYCMKDVYYLMLGVEKYRIYFKENFNIGLGLTTPSMALKVFQKKFLSDKSFLTLSRRNKFFDVNYYFGGHTEKFTSGVKYFKGLNYYDVNSLYPFVMANLEMPNAKYRRATATKENLSRFLKNGRLFFCELTVNIDSEMLRFFPVLDEKNKVNLYPFGEQRIKISEVGVQFILDFGCMKNIIEVHTIIVGENLDIIKPFKNYVETFYAKRKSEVAYDVLFKLLLNSLYGKFGQKLVRDIKILNNTDENKKAKSIVESEDGVFVSTFEEQSKLYSMSTNRLDIAGKVTEVARLYMGRIINKIRASYGNDSVIYTDTDSIMCNVVLEEDENFNDLIDGKVLGLMKNEIGYSDDAIILGQKMYHFLKSGKKATKGVKNMDYEDFVEFVEKGENKFENLRFSRFNSLINKGFHGVQRVPFELQNIRERLDT